MGLPAAVGSQLADGSHERAGETRIEFDLIQATGISAVTLQNAQVSSKLDDAEIHFQVDSHLFLHCCKQRRRRKGESQAGSRDFASNALPDVLWRWQADGPYVVPQLVQRVFQGRGWYGARSP